MRFIIRTAYIPVVTLLCIFYSCRHDPFPTPAGENNFPDSIAAIMVSKCATTGCHDAAGAVNAGRLRLDTWAELFKGSANGAVAVPYNTDFSPLLYFINTDSARGTVALPTMPYTNMPLSNSEYYTIKNWIAAGAPDKHGNIAFAGNPDTRQKIYMTQQGCDLVAVVDAESKLIMRMIPIGMAYYPENPHAIRMTADGAYAFVSFANGTYVQKIDTRSDTVVASVDMNGYEGGILNISPDKQKIIVAGFNQNRLLFANFSTMQSTLIETGNIIAPHGIAANPGWDTFFVAAQYGNTIYRCTPGKIPVIYKIPLDTAYTAVDNISQTYSDPHELIMSPDHSKLFASCQYANTVRVLDAHTYKVLAVIPVGKDPQEFALSPARHLLFVTCMEDAGNPKPGCKGSVYAIDYNTMQVVAGPIYGDFYQPHGIAVDEQNNVFYVISRNADHNGPAPHHATKCGGTDGWYSIYNLSTLQPINTTRYETTPDPYSAISRFN